MKKVLLITVLFSLSFQFLKSQCVPNCGVYTLTPITYSLFPSSGTDAAALLSPNLDDGYTPPVPLGFNFNYYCTTYSTVLICSNGFLVFSNTGTPALPFADPAQALPNSTAPNGLICLNMNDFDVSTGGSITYTTIGTAPNRQFVVTFSAVPIWNASPQVLNTGQIVLFEGSNNIEIHSINIGQSPNLMTQGIEDPTGSSGSAPPGRNNAFWSATNSSYRWENTLIGLAPTGLVGNTVACAGDVVSYSVNTNTAVASYNWALPNNWQAPSTTVSAITATAATSGNVLVAATYTGCGTSTPAIIAVTVNPLPVISVINVSPALVCSGETVAVNLAGASVYTIQPSGQTGSAPFTFTPAISTVYSVTGVSQAGCYSASATIIPTNVDPTPTVTVNSGAICLGETFTMVPTGAVNYTFSSLFAEVTPTATGTFVYLVTGATANNFCSSQAAASVTVNPLPNPTIVASRTIICANESVSLTAQGGSTYLWLNNSSTSSSLNPTLTTSVEYTVVAKNTFSCSAEAKKAIAVNPCLGLDEINRDPSFMTVYPNPSAGVFHLACKQAASVSIVDISGKEVYSAKVEEGTTSIELGHDIPSGIYLLRAVSNNTTQTRVLVKD